MKEKTGEVFSISKDNEVIEYCTLSKEICSNENKVIYFSLAKDTDISLERHIENKIILVNSGNLIITAGERKNRISKDELIIVPANLLMGVKAKEDSVYTEVSTRRLEMNKAIEVGEVFKLKEILPYSDGRIVNMDLVSNDKMKFVLMSFDKDTGLSEHSAPGDAIVFAIEGDAIISYEGIEHKISEGENFHFEKGGLHSVKAISKFKMALLLILE